MNQLEGPQNAHLHSPGRGQVGDVFTLVEHPALFRHVESGQEIDERRFSCSVGPDNSQGLLFGQFKVNIVDGNKISKSFCDPFGDQHRLGAHKVPLIIEGQLRSVPRLRTAAEGGE